MSLRALADAVGTPTYVYSKAALLEPLAAYDRAFRNLPHLVCYSVKANSNLGVLSTLARAGAGADIVSGGELFRALRAGVPSKRIVFSGIGKTREEMREALKADILLFNVESQSELRALDEVARAMGMRAPVSLRVNPDVDPQTHPYIATGLKTAKFGIPIEQAPAAYELAVGLGGLDVVGVQMHIGSQLTKTGAVRGCGGPAGRAGQDAARGRHRDPAGRCGRRARHPLPRRAAAQPPRSTRRCWSPGLRELGVTVLLEPGRSIVGNAGRAAHPRPLPQGHRAPSASSSWTPP